MEKGSLNSVVMIVLVILLRWSRPPILLHVSIYIVAAIKSVIYGESEEKLVQDWVTHMHGFTNAQTHLFELNVNSNMRELYARLPCIYVRQPCLYILLCIVSLVFKVGARATSFHATHDVPTGTSNAFSIGDEGIRAPFDIMPTKKNPIAHTNDALQRVFADITFSQAQNDDEKPANVQSNRNSTKVHRRHLNIG